MKKKNTSFGTLTKLVTAAMLSAVSFVLYLLEFPILPGASHLKLDLSDIPALVCSLVSGPVWGVIVELLKNLIEMLVRGIGTQMGFGNLMNFIVGCAYVVPFTLVFNSLSKKQAGKTKKIIISGITGIIAIVAAGLIGNYLIDPPFFKFFMGVTLDSPTLWAAIWSATALNAIKGVMLTAVAFPIVLALLDRIRKVIKL